MKKKRILLVLLAFVIATFSPITALASKLPYDSYNYDYRKYIHFTPAPYEPAGNIELRMLKGGDEYGNLSNPQDMCVGMDGNIYIADTGNNRIVVLNNDLTEILGIIDSFINNGTADSFSQPYGVCVSEKNELYIADSQNHRVVVLDADRNLVRIVSNPESESLDDTFIFTPFKVTVDYADRLYVIAQNMFEGIMVFETDGKFASFFGTIDVEISLWQKFWRRIATKEERSNQRLFIPTEFTGLDIDPSGFVYATNIDTKGERGVRRLNPKGEDVIKKGQNKNVGGDILTDGNTDYSGPSQFTDVVYRESGIYSCLDRKRGRVFTYDHEGNLLYIFGGLGTQTGTFKLPVAIEDIGGRITVLDGDNGNIVLFDVTEYGDLINQAVALRYDGDEALAVPMWQRVLELDEDNELANTGIGKAYLTAGDYKLAMKYLKLGMNREYYSIAFKRYRNSLLTKNAGYFLTAVAVIIIGLLIYKNVKKRRNKEASYE